MSATASPLRNPNSFELRLTGPEGLLFRRVWDVLQSPWVETEPLAIRADTPFEISVRRPSDRRGPARLRLGDEAIESVPAAAGGFETDYRTWLRDELGESRLILEGRAAHGREILFELPLIVEPRPEVAADYRAMIAEVSIVHEGLARAVAGRSRFRAGIGSGEVDRLDPQIELIRLDGFYRRLVTAIASIAEQPSVTLDRDWRLARYRGGDRIDASATATIARDPAVGVDRSGRLTSLGKIRVRLPVLSDDLPEHRHIAERIRRLANRARDLARHCEQAADEIAAEQRRWSSAVSRRFDDGGEGASDAEPTRWPDRLGLPRAEALEKRAEEARSLADAFLALVRGHRFLAEAGPPRTPFGPSPAFLGRTAYREVFNILVDAGRHSGILVDGDDVRVAYQGMSKLYEYWCFLRVLRRLRERLGPPAGGEGFSQVGEVLRTDLKPGVTLIFSAPGGFEVAASYEPEFHPRRSAGARGDRFASSLTTLPIRPDIVVEVRRNARDLDSKMLILDAKSTEDFHARKLREITDYARQIHDPREGRQPVRQVFLLHRGREKRLLLNVPERFLDRRPDLSLIGAFPCVPSADPRRSDFLFDVLDRFLTAFASLPSS